MLSLLLDGDVVLNSLVLDFARRLSLALAALRARLGTVRLQKLGNVDAEMNEPVPREKSTTLLQCPTNAPPAVSIAAVPPAVMGCFVVPTGTMSTGEELALGAYSSAM